MTTPQTPAEKAALLYRTLDWLEANPDKAITGRLATNAQGERVRPDNPAAECFCFLGRLIVEAGPEVKLGSGVGMRKWFADFHATPRILASVNDGYSIPKTRFRYLRDAIDSITHRIGL